MSDPHPYTVEELRHRGWRLVTRMAWHHREHGLVPYSRMVEIEQEADAQREAAGDGGEDE